MIGIQVLLLTAEWRQCSRGSVVMPGLVPRLGISRTPPLSVIVLPNGEPCFQERASHSKRCSDGASQQVRERLTFFRGQVLRLVQEQCAVEPQILAHSAHLVPVVPWCRWWLQRRREPDSCDQLGNRRRIRGRQFEPLADRVLIDPDCTGEGARRLDLWA
jgi:hypothetical protein